MTATQVIRGRLARVFEECSADVTHPNVASWEREWLLTWRERSPLVMSAFELELLNRIERGVLGVVR